MIQPSKVHNYIFHLLLPTAIYFMQVPDLYDVKYSLGWSLKGSKRRNQKNNISTSLRNTRKKEAGVLVRTFSACCCKTSKWKKEKSRNSTMHSPLFRNLCHRRKSKSNKIWVNYYQISVYESHASIHSTNVRALKSNQPYRLNLKSRSGLKPKRVTTVPSNVTSYVSLLPIPKFSTFGC